MCFSVIVFLWFLRRGCRNYIVSPPGVMTLAICRAFFNWLVKPTARQVTNLWWILPPFLAGKPSFETSPIIQGFAGKNSSWHLSHLENIGKNISWLKFIPTVSHNHQAVYLTGKHMAGLPKGPQSPECFTISVSGMLNISELTIMDVSENSGTPKSSILIGCSIINHPFWGFSPYFWKHPYNWNRTALAYQTPGNLNFDIFCWWIPHAPLWKKLFKRSFQRHVP